MSSTYASRLAISVPDAPEEAVPSLQLKALERMGNEIAELSADLQVGEYRFLCLIREFDEGRGWLYQGARSCAQWLSWRVGLDGGAAREKVRVARALGNLPRISEALSRGAISYSKVRAMTRLATPENEDSLLQVALHATASQVERMVRARRKPEPTDAASQPKEPPFSMRQEKDGTWVVRGRLTAEVGAFLLKALQVVGDASLEEDPEEGVSAETFSPSTTPGESDRYPVVVPLDQPSPQEASASAISVLEPTRDVSAETSARIAFDARLPIPNVDLRHWSTGHANRRLGRNGADRAAPGAAGFDGRA